MGTACKTRAHKGTTMDRTASRNVSAEPVGDFLDLGCRAFMGGVAAALLFALLALGLSLSANAAGGGPKINETKAGTLLLQSGTPGQYAAAPQLETEVAIQVTGLIARTRVSQLFHNPGGDFVEGIYVFPLPEKAAVDHMDMQIGDRLIEGQIKEKEEARKTYEKAKSEGKKAALVEQLRPNLFTNAVAHIGPDDFVRITIEYQQTLAYENGEYRLRFPLTVTPRYTPDAGGAEAMPDESKALEAAMLRPVAFLPVCDGLANPVD